MTGSTPMARPLSRLRTCDVAWCQSCLRDVPNSVLASSADRHRQAFPSVTNPVGARHTRSINDQGGVAMNRYALLSLPAAVGLLVAVVPTTAVAQEKTLKQQLVGTWNLTAWERTAPDGTKVHAYGSNPKGVAYFGADGRFFVFFTRGDLPRLSSNDRSKATPEEAKRVMDGTIAYAGTYTLDEPSKTIAYRIEVTSFPNQLGQDQKRVITSLTGDELKFTNPGASAGGKIDVTMKRAE
jgi:lipocalin-like protein